MQLTLSFLTLFLYPSSSTWVVTNNLKSVTSRKIREEFPKEVTAMYGEKRVFWTEGYSIDSCGDAPLNVLVKYVQNQAGCKPQPH